MVYGRVTPPQRDIIKRICTISTVDYKAIMNWLIDNHTSYHGIQKSESCPQPMVIGGFNERTNTTD